VVKEFLYHTNGDTTAVSQLSERMPGAVHRDMFLDAGNLNCFFQSFVEPNIATIGSFEISA
jgi:hypothetical protein